MTPLKPPVACNHVPALPGWSAVFDVELANDGGTDLVKEPVLAWRMETFEIMETARGRPIERFDSVTPILASGSISDASLYLLQLGSIYFDGDGGRIETKDEAIQWFRKQRA
jgi:hypothetical protein